MNFFDQRGRLNAQSQNLKWRSNQAAKYYQGTIKEAVRKRDNEFIRKNIQTGSFREFADAAYNSPRGYAIRTNPVTGEREMMVAGTRNVKDWFSNILESGGSHVKLPHWLAKYRGNYTKFLADEARKNGVTVIYGHSRGATIANLVPVDATKIGVDGATVLSRKKPAYNISQNQWFDRAIGARGNTVYTDKQRVFKRNRYKRFGFEYNKKFHFLYR